MDTTALVIILFSLENKCCCINIQEKNVMNCRDVFIKKILKVFNTIISGVTVCCSRVLARSEVPTVLGCGHTRKRNLIQFQKLIV